MLLDARLAGTVLLGLLVSSNFDHLGRRAVLAEYLEADPTVMASQPHGEVFVALRAAHGLVVRDPLGVLSLVACSVVSSIHPR